MERRATGLYLGTLAQMKNLLSLASFQKTKIYRADVCWLVCAFQRQFQDKEGGREGKKNQYIVFSSEAN